MKKLENLYDNFFERAFNKKRIFEENATKALQIGDQLVAHLLNLGFSEEGEIIRDLLNEVRNHVFEERTAKRNRSKKQELFNALQSTQRSRKKKKK